MHLTSMLDYVIAIIGMLIIVVSFGWNIYEVFFREALHTHATGDETKTSSSDSAIR